MKYEFHVGDYVETVAGFIGWVSNVDHNYITMTSNDGIISGPWSIPEEQYHFNRIGQYDFTKKDEGKIKLLAEEYTKSFPVCKTVTTENDLNWCSIDIGVMGKKINELIEVINRLGEEI